MQQLNIREAVLKSLIAIGLIAIVASLYIQYGIRYFHQKSLENLDNQRIGDIDSLNVSIKTAINNFPNASLGDANTVYISIPSDQPNCSNINLPSLPSGWQYHCVATSTLQNVDGTGWLPVDFRTYAQSAILKLPLDPLNNAESLNYYTFVTLSGTTVQYELSAGLSTKTLLSSSEEHNSVDPEKYSIGNDPVLLSNATGLQAYWSMSSTSDNETIPDESGNQNNIDLPVNDIYSTTGCLLEICVTNKGTNDLQISIPSLLSLASGDDASYLFWFNAGNIPSQNVQIFNPGTDRLDTNIEGESGALFVWFNSNEPKGYQVFKSSSQQYTDKRWHQIAITKSETAITVYMDGEQVGRLKIPLPSNKDMENGTITLSPGLSMNGLRIYSRTLSQKEVAENFSFLSK